MLDKSWIVAKKASQRRAVCSDPNYALQSGIIGVKLGAGLLRTTENISVCNQPNTCCSFKKLHSTTLEDDNISKDKYACSQEKTSLSTIVYLIDLNLIISKTQSAATHVYFALKSSYR